MQQYSILKDMCFLKGYMLWQPLEVKTTLSAQYLYSDIEHFLAFREPKHAHSYIFTSKDFLYYIPKIIMIHILVHATAAYDNYNY